MASLIIHDDLGNCNLCEKLKIKQGVFQEKTILDGLNSFGFSKYIQGLVPKS